MKYINRTGITTPIGKIVKLDKDGRGVILSQPADTTALGVVISVISGEVEVVSDGVRMTFINGVFKSGDIVYLRKSSQTGALGSCYASATPIAPYVRIGTAVEAGSSRMARIAMGISMVSSGTTTGTGIPGPMGPQGLPGPIGPRGLAGEKGDDGHTPIKGVDYFDGIPGYTPIKGVDYFDGEAGPQGPKGDDGALGLPGYIPVKGVDYFDGAIGPQGPKGDDGYTPIKNVDYSDGAKGDQGERGFQGEIGPQGVKGDNGLQGERGLQGLPGTTPVKGVDYFDGATGPAGYTPIKGVDYFDGVKGDKGDPGTNATVTKEAVEGVLIGEISTHTHAGGSGGLTQQQIEGMI